MNNDHKVSGSNNETCGRMFNKLREDFESQTDSKSPGTMQRFSMLNQPQLAKKRKQDVITCESLRDEDSHNVSFMYKPVPQNPKAASISASLLSVGPWQTVSQYGGDLVVKFYYATKKLIWEVLDRKSKLKRKFEIEWSNISAIRAFMPENQPAVLDIELFKPPLFFEEIPPQPHKHTTWKRSTDFTTGGQASTFRRHRIEFAPALLNSKLEILLSHNERLYTLSQKPFPSHESPYFTQNNNVPSDPAVNAHEPSCWPYQNQWQPLIPPTVMNPCFSYQMGKLPRHRKNQVQQLQASCSSRQGSLFSCQNNQFPCNEVMMGLVAAAATASVNDQIPQQGVLGSVAVPDQAQGFDVMASTSSMNVNPKPFCQKNEVHYNASTQPVNPIFPLEEMSASLLGDSPIVCLNDVGVVTFEDLEKLLEEDVTIESFPSHESPYFTQNNNGPSAPAVNAHESSCWPYQNQWQLSIPSTVMNPCFSYQTGKLPRHRQDQVQQLQASCSSVPDQAQGFDVMASTSSMNVNPEPFCQTNEVHCNTSTEPANPIFPLEEMSASLLGDLPIVCPNDVGVVTFEDLEKLLEEDDTTESFPSHESPYFTQNDNGPSVPAVNAHEPSCWPYQNQWQPLIPPTVMNPCFSYQMGKLPRHRQNQVQQLQAICSCRQGSLFSCQNNQFPCNEGMIGPDAAAAATASVNDQIPQPGVFGSVAVPDQGQGLNLARHEHSMASTQQLNTLFSVEEIEEFLLGDHENEGLSDIPKPVKVELHEEFAM